MNSDRAQAAYAFRVDAAEKARQREHPTHKANSDEQRYASADYPMSFTKGLEHDSQTGLVARPADFEAFRTAIDDGFAEPFTTRVRVPACEDCKDGRRKWEAPTAGVVFDLQGPDCQAVTMPPAPALRSDELTYEMAEVYELALLRDRPLHAFGKTCKEGQNDDEAVRAVDCTVARLNNLTYARKGFGGRPRMAENGNLTRQTVFRGSSPGVENGPYLSQFLLIGNRNPVTKRIPEDGYISYGAQEIDQRVLEAKSGDDYMMKWCDWLNVQQGCDPGSGLKGQDFTGKRRFIHTPRDLATYVHVDQLYQAYLNACLILLNFKTPFDPSFDLLSGSDDHKLMVNAANKAEVPANAGGFALWGGPHILSLVTEVATRALKAVRYQKFNNHLRLRPEALAARIHQAAVIDKDFPVTCGAFTKMRRDIQETVTKIEEHNKKAVVNGGEETALLPMAFKEGSPMHPTYGAGHATVAGACVTMLKAFFDTSAVFAKIDGEAAFYGKSKIEEAARCKATTIEYGGYETTGCGKSLEFKEFPITCDHGADGEGDVACRNCCPLTLEGELNKLAANISIGRNMAGVHFFSDYYDSVRMGEKIALGILEEQALGYPTDRFVLSVPTFDGETVRIGTR